MRTIHCSGRLSCHACHPPQMPPAMHTPLPCMPPFTMPAPFIPHIPPSPCKPPPFCHTCPPLPCIPLSPCMSPLCHAHPLSLCMPPCGQNDRHDRCLRKHYLSATTVADGKFVNHGLRRIATTIRVLKGINRSITSSSIIFPHCMKRDNQ